jgi:hypothetical protein
MTDARWQQVKALFEAAVERPPVERAAFLAAATGGDDALRREIESLLDSASSDPGFTDRLPFRDRAALAESEPPRQATPPEPGRPSSALRMSDRIASSRCSGPAGWGRCSARATANCSAMLR